MPGFVKTPKDEARWSKAKEAAGKETEHGSESFYKLSNYIYHKMGKTEEDQKMAELYKSEITNDFASGKVVNIENIRPLLMDNMPARQSSLSNEVVHMSDEKKYTAQEAAVAVLKKAEEMLKNYSKGVHLPVNQHGITHSGMSPKQEAGHSNMRQVNSGAAKIQAKATLGELKAMPKPNLTKDEPVGEIHPKEPQAGESEKPGDRIQAQAAPDKNPKEQAEGNNELAGTTPTQVGLDGKNKPGFDEMRGHIKLAKFIGHMQAKRKQKMPGAV